MTSTRAPVPPVDLKARIAAFQEQQKASAKQTSSSTSATLPKPPASSGNTNLRDRIASFEKQGAVPAPKSRFGFAPIPQQDEPAPLKRHGELYGNRIPGLSRPHIPVPPSTKGTKRDTSRPRDARRLELERYATSPSPPGSPFLHSENGESVSDVLSDSDLNSSDNPLGRGQEEAQMNAFALMSPPVSEVPVEEGEQLVISGPTDADSSEEVAESSHETGEPSTAEPADDTASVGDEPAPTSSVIVSPSPVATESKPTVHEPIAEPEQVQAVPPKPEPEVETDPADPPADHGNSEQAHTVPEVSLTSENGPVALDPAVQAVIEQLDRATQSGDAGAVVVPAAALETLAALGNDQHKSVQDMLDQLLLQQEALDIATPVKQRFSLNGQLSSQAVLDYLAQQSNLSKDTDPTTPPRATGASRNEYKADDPQTQSSQFLSPASASVYSVDSSPGGDEPLSPASDIYSAYATTPSAPEKFRRALPAIPEAPDSPNALRGFRRGTFGADSDGFSAGSSAPTSAPLKTPSDDGLFSAQQDTKSEKADTHGSVAPSDGMVRIAGTPPRVTSPPLSVVIPQAAPAKPAQAPARKAEEPIPDPSDAVIVNEPRRRVSPTVSRATLVPAPQSASGSSSSPASNYSPNSTYSGDGTSPSSTGPVSRKPSRRSTRSRVVSPAPPSAPFEEPELTPIEGPRGFRAVVHGKVIEGKSRPVSMNMQYPDLPSPSPLNASGMSDLAALLADAVVFEKQLADVRTPSKKPRAAPQSTSSPPPALSRSSSDRPRPTQDLPESPEDQESFARASQDRAAARMFHASGRPLPAQPRPTRPSTERSVERKASRPSLERVPSRPSLDQSTLPRPSAESTSSSRPGLQPMFLTADPNAVRIPLPPRPKSAMAHTSPSSRNNQSSTPPPPPPPKSPPRTGYLTNLLSRAKSSGSLRPSADSRDSVGSSSEDSVMVATPPTPPYDGSVSEIGSMRRSSTMFKNSFSRATNFADRLLHRKDGSNQGADVAIASGDDEDGLSGSQRVLPRPPRPLPLPPQPQPPRGLPPPVPGNSAPDANGLAPIPPPGQPQLSRRSSWKSIASVSTTGITEALDTAGLYDSFPTVPESVPQSNPQSVRGLPSGPAAYTSPRPAPLPPLPPPSHPLPPPPAHPLPPPPRGASMAIPLGGRPGLPASPASRPKTLPSRPKVPPQQLRSGMI
ncbi:hypothetical protein BV20DRAFT_1014457 [Pilatotrama ljubarskyi]|nr:hypothetical protein BV20DRAFT_1014457 [Pilatotrama ljubarskyi]